MEKSYIFPLLLVVLLHTFTVSFSASPTNFTDQQALLAFKSLITSTGNVLANNWTSKTSFCSWIGVSCSRKRQRVASLRLANMNLQGTISPSIANLSFLTTLNLGNNSFHGNLPYDIGYLPRLRVIDVQSNQLEGQIPPSFFQNHQLQTMSMAYNSFSGDLCREDLCILPELRVLNLIANNFTGTLHPSIGNISKLEILALQDNHFNGDIPKEIGNLNSLMELNLKRNQFTGQIPVAIFNISSLHVLDLQNNSLSGSFQIDGQYHQNKIEIIDLSINQLSGEIPPGLCQFPELKILSLAFNNFAGLIPRNIGCLTKLDLLDLTDNDISGTLPPSFGNISNLQTISCSQNVIEGEVPQEFGNLLNLQTLTFELNNLTGALPEAIFNISSLAYIAFSNNNLTGHIPGSTGLRLPNLLGIYLIGNRLTGEIPISISNASMLTELEMSDNFFSGLVPSNLGNLRQLEYLNLGANQLTNEPEIVELRFLNSLVECRMLQYLLVGYNPLKGVLPESVGNLSTSLQMFNIEYAQLKGSIPRGIGNLSSMISLVLGSNSLGGSIPLEIGELKQLQRLYLGGNNLQGSVPMELCQLVALGDFMLPENQISGLIPDCIGNLSRLGKIIFRRNNLVSTLPSSLWELKGLLHMDLSHNFLVGELPLEVRNLAGIDTVDLSGNLLSGRIPSTIGDLKSLRHLSLSNNSFQGLIPPSLGSTINLEFLDLSSNALMGTIPSSLENLRYLKYINVSFNHLEGEIPSGGAFANSSNQSFMGNKGLCGMPELLVPPCPTNSTHTSKLKMIFFKCVIPAVASVAFVGALVCLRIRHRSIKRKASVPDDLSEIRVHQIVSYHELQQATENFSDANLLGVGGSGSVYKGILSGGKVVAVKVLDLEQGRGLQRFDAECEVMRRIRHRNLVKIITTCSNNELRAIVLQYMPNGSLERWLHTQSCHLDLLQRINIMIDVAAAMEYLHHGSDEPVVHCDLKPSNVLLDEDMVAHVSDFGIAKILAENNLTAQTKTFATIGYIAPEYGSEGVVSTRGDVYSYGIMLMETFTKRKPTDEMFTANLSLRQWVNASYPNAVMKIIDADIFAGESPVADEQVDCMLPIIELALDCSKEAPEERIDAKEVVTRFNKIRQKLLRVAN